MIHVDKSGSLSEAIGFYNRLVSLDVDFDIIGLSYYATWHGNIETMQATVNGLALRYAKPIVIAETGYRWLTGDGRCRLVDKRMRPANAGISSMGSSDFI